MSQSHSIPRFPLEWPAGWVRTMPSRRQRATFKHLKVALSVAVATDRLERQVEMMGGTNATLSSNVSLRLDGRPRSDDEPRDPGVALYFDFKGRATVLASDRWDRVADNIGAIAAHIDALRRVERYGVGTIEQALSGYKALPQDTASNWRNVFGFGLDQVVTMAQVQSAFETRAKMAHPDKGGTDEAMSHLNRARGFARAELAK